MSDVVRWILDYGGQHEYRFPRNPDKPGGDTYWKRELRGTEINVLGSNLPMYFVDGFNGAKRDLHFSAIKGSMMRVLEQFYFRQAVIENCTDHLYPTTTKFSCMIIDFHARFRPVHGTFPGSYEDTWDLDMTLLRMS